MKTEVKKKEMSYDEKLESFVLDILLPHHTEISRVNVVEKDPAIDLAIDKISQAMSAINQRLKRRRDEGTYGKD